MTELELLQQISDLAQAQVELLSFVAGVFFAFIVAVTWKG